MFHRIRIVNLNHRIMNNSISNWTLLPADGRKRGFQTILKENNQRIVSRNEKKSGAEERWLIRPWVFRACGSRTKPGTSSEVCLTRVSHPPAINHSLLINQAIVGPRAWRVGTFPARVHPFRERSRSLFCTKVTVFNFYKLPPDLLITGSHLD